MTDDQQAFLDKLVLFAKTGDPEHIGRADLSDGEVKALMLLVTMYSNKLSLDMRLISPAYADSPGNKASRSAANIAEYYRRYEDQKGTQMVFCDLSTYKPGIWNVYSEIKRKLVEDHGIPAQEIRFVQEAASDKVRQAMFDAMNEGKIRVLFGSTQKLGTGVNAQQRIVCMHHLDIPWRPMDLEQRNGRGARKGNIVAKEYAGNKVKAYVYAVLRTLDAYKLNLLHNKQQFIDQLKRNRLGARRLDEGAISEDSGMNFAEWMAVVSGNTDLLQKAKLEGRIAALESEQTIFMRTRHEAQSQLQRYTAEIGRRDAMLERLKRDWDYINEVAPPDAKGKRANPLRIDGVESADIVAHGKRLVEIYRTVNTGDDYQKIGTLFDFRILVRTERMQKDGLALTVNKFMVEGLDGIKYTFNNGHLAAEPKTAATNFIRALDTIPSLMARLAPAVQRHGRLAEQRVGQCHQARGNVVENVIDARGGPAEAFEARVAVAPHGIECVAQAVQHHARRTGHGEPEQRGEHRIAAVLQHRLGGGTGHGAFVQFAGFAADHVADALACLLQVTGLEGAGHRLGVFIEAAQADGGVEGDDAHQGADPGQLGQPPGGQGQRQHGDHPGADAMAAPATATGVEALLEALGPVAEGHQRVPAPWLAKDGIQHHGGQCQHAQAHSLFPHWFSNSNSDNGRGCAQPSSASIGAG